MDKKKSQAALQSAHDQILAHPVFTLMRWLANGPSGDEVARELALNYFQLFGATQTRLVTTDEVGTLRYIGDFGFEKTMTGVSLNVDQWQSLNTEIVKIEIGPNGLGWSSTGKYLQARVNDFGDIRGWITIGFSNENVDHFETELLMQVLKHAVGLYLSGQHKANRSNHSHQEDHSHQPHSAGREAFTPRQLSILGGMVEGKTNHELASELGFSVSTVRHETMRIYQILSVSDRREAAREALERKIF